MFYLPCRSLGASYVGGEWTIKGMIVGIIRYAQKNRYERGTHYD